MYSNNDFRSYELYHHGVKGQKWGVRRYQNSDGSLTENGKKRYGQGPSKDKKKEGFRSKVKKQMAKRAREYAQDNSLEAQRERDLAEVDRKYNTAKGKDDRARRQGGFAGTSDAYIGNGARAVEHEEKAKYYDRIAKTYSNQSKRKELEAAAATERYRAQFEEQKSKEIGKGGWNSVRQVGQNWLTGDQEILDVPYVKASGKVSNGRKRVLDDALFETLLDVTFDAVTKKDDPLSSFNKNFDDNYRKNKSKYVREFRTSGN